MLKRINIGKRLGLAFGVIIVVLATAVWIAVHGFISLKAAMRSVKDQSDQIILAEDAQAHALRTMVYVGGVAGIKEAAAQQAYLAEIDSNRAEYKAKLEKMKGTADSEAKKEHILAVESVIGGSRDINNQVIELAKGGRNEEAIRKYVNDSVPLLTKWDAAFERLNNHREMMMEELISRTEAQIHRNLIVILGAGAVAIILAVLLGIVISRSIVDPIRSFMGVLGSLAEGDLTRRAQVDSRDEIGHLGASLNQALARLRETMQEVNGAAMSVSSGATELSASAEQMSTTTDEIAKSGELLHGATESVATATLQFLSSVEHVAGNVRTSIEHTNQVVGAAEDGAGGATDLSGGMNRIREATEKISRAIAVIREIAQQTNLLSLNAAIEAAKAGEQGKGFSVVAEEVRKLAERSRQATVEIENLLQETHAAVEEGVASTNLTGQLMARIQHAIAGTSRLIQEIGGATQEQSRTASEIAKRMDESAREVGQNAVATQELSATVQEITRTASDLARISVSMAETVARFKV